MSNYVAYVPAQAVSPPMVHKITDVPTNRGVFHLLQREPIHHATITKIKFGVSTYYAAAFGFKINDDGHDPDLEYVQYSPSSLAQLLRDDKDGPTIYGPLVLVYSMDPTFIEATIKSVLVSGPTEDVSTRVAKEFAIRRIDSNGIAYVQANDGQVITYSKKKAEAVLQQLAKDHKDQHFELVGQLT